MDFQRPNRFNSFWDILYACLEIFFLIEGKKRSDQGEHLAELLLLTEYPWIPLYT